MINFSEESEWKEFAVVLEKNSFDELKAYLQKLRLSERPKFDRFYDYLENEFLWGEVCRQKIYLAILVTKKSNVVALQDDRTRIVLALAKLKGKSLEEANRILAKEFGDYFKLLPSYSVSNKIISFQEIIKKAIEITNALKNISYLSVEDTARDIMAYFNSCTFNTKETLENAKQTTFDLMMGMRDPLAFINPTEFNSIKPKIIQFYRQMNRTELNVKQVENDPDYDEIAKFVYTIAQIISIKLKLLEKNYAPTDYKRAQEIIFSRLAGIFFKDRLSIEEIERTGMPLPKAP